MRAEDSIRLETGVLVMDVKNATDVGRLRQNNEDSFWVGERCLVVCDGMGGHLAGEVASRLATEAIRAFPFRGEDPDQEVRQAILSAQSRILEAAAADERYLGMGTTITLAHLAPFPQGGARLTIGHVGDSRGYLFCDGVLEQLTSDHSVVGELLRTGTITQNEARHHAKRHMVTQALGSPGIDIELISKSLRPGALVLLCTDGLTDVVEDQLIAQILAKSAATPNVAQDLVDLANELGGPDNITVIVAQV